MMVMIYSNHLVNQKIEIVNGLKEQSEEYKSRNAYAQSRLIHIKMESELSKEMGKDSLMTLESHPTKLLIKWIQLMVRKGSEYNEKEARCFLGICLCWCSPIDICCIYCPDYHSSEYKC